MIMNRHKAFKDTDDNSCMFYRSGVCPDGRGHKRFCSLRGINFNCEDCDCYEGEYDYLRPSFDDEWSTLRG